MVSVSAGLVVADEESNIIHLVHYMTQDYFEARKEYWFPDAEPNFKMICVTYLSFNTFESGPCLSEQELEARLQQNQLYDYVVRNWGYHAYATATKLEQLILDLLESDTKVSASSQALITEDYFATSHHKSKRITALHLIAYFGLNEAASTLLRYGKCLNSKDTDGRTPLPWAAQNGHDGISSCCLRQARPMLTQKTH
ncbi:uncharacterized protein EURHEDRAFT_405844 [Aspergillus ruber CBS 135680]|uniref:Uncharacterized protein n=1 Tax=Aspergillus ruber (strain CBS 135680) TaxID=1388766 RepID=A0A017S4E4_ASPRC|nr:uncharacterized protein EURHEDRAFT_405844 [Aspergillus ruber CBS 135680]EYE91706.1 hypothetical protein EURHEDRAFT_405844 [Aspergillus ruber CBS 135680]